MTIAAVVGVALEGVLQGLGIASGIGLIASIVSSMSGLVDMLSSFMKMIGYLLQPIAMVFMVMLYPILLMLKPIILAVNQIMLPFFKAAMNLFKAGAEAMQSGDLASASQLFTTGALVLLNGISIVIMSVTNYIVQMFVDMLMNIIILVVGSISPYLGDKISTIQDSMSNFIGGFTTMMSSLLITGTAALITTAGQDATMFESQAKEAVNSFLIDDGSITTQMVDEITNTQDITEATMNFIFNGAGGLTPKSVYLASEVGRQGTSKINKIIEAANKRAAQIIADAEKSSHKGLISGGRKTK